MENISNKALTPSTWSLSTFNSNWFVIVMGFGGVLNVSAQLWGVTGSSGQWISGGVWINTGIFAFLIVIWLIRWLVTPSKMWQEMMHPVMGHFFALIPIAMTIMGMNWSLMSGAVGQLAINRIMNIFWLLSISLGLFISIVITEAQMRQTAHNTAQVSFAWLLGSVSTALFPLLGNIIVAMQWHLYPLWTRFVNVTDMAFVGMGLFLFIFFAAYLLGRYFSAPAPPAPGTPTSWLLLGAAAVLSLSILGVARDSTLVKELPGSSFAVFLAVALWGLAGWSFLLGFVMAFRVWIQKKLPFTLSWWAFVFPVSAYVLDSRSIATAIHVGWLVNYGDIFSALLYLFFAIVLLNTVAAALTGRLFRQG
ncbi:hypothetical protein [Sulfobacillus thermosulfidooxidans]|uniref:SLAC1 family transporter n=1 Tax=Sulfobacillus thermosulfidooxidans TaxID=28034 RepID=UPI0006B6179F|nr:hypothetical protein [Sulfobacillus thermosulfidooxidans]